jgi:Ni/Fe-hydrogenase subunit HybB-like protein
LKKGRKFFRNLLFALVYLGVMGLIYFFVTPYLTWTPLLTQPLYFAVVYIVGTGVFLVFGQRRKYFYLEDSLRELLLFCSQGLFVGMVLYFSWMLFSIQIGAWWAGPLLFPLYRTGWLTHRKEKRRR